jgi:hypothetical protein
LIHENDDSWPLLSKKNTLFAFQSFNLFHPQQSLVVNPVLCRGASFDLEIDLVSQGRKKSNSSTSFLSTEFLSPNPEETAQAISERLAIRMGSPSPVLSHFFGIR